MDALQLKLCDIQGRLFEFFADCGYAANDLVKLFMTGTLAKNLDSEYNRMQWAGEEYLLEELLSQNESALKSAKDDISTDVLYWMGYLYRYWHYYTQESSEKIYKQAPFETMSTNYLMFHTMDSEVAIDDLKEIYRQKKTKIT